MHSTGSRWERDKCVISYHNSQQCYLVGDLEEKSQDQQVDSSWDQWIFVLNDVPMHHVDVELLHWISEQFDMRSPKLLWFILWGTRMFVQNIIALHPTFVKIYHSWTNWRNDIKCFPQAECILVVEMNAAAFDSVVCEMNKPVKKCLWIPIFGL